MERMFKIQLSHYDNDGSLQHTLGEMHFHQDAKIEEVDRWLSISMKSCMGCAFKEISDSLVPRPFEPPSGNLCDRLRR